MQGSDYYRLNETLNTDLSPLMLYQKRGLISYWLIFIFYLKICLLFIFREREGQGEKHQLVVDSPAPPLGDPPCNSSMRPDQEPNPQPTGSQANLRAHTSQGSLFLFLSPL